MNKLSAEKVDDIMDKLEDAMQSNSEIDNVLMMRNDALSVTYDDDELEKELEGLINSQKPVTSISTATTPSVSADDELLIKELENLEIASTPLKSASHLVSNIQQQLAE